MKPWYLWTWLVAIWVTPAQGRTLHMRVAPEFGSCQDEAGNTSRTADATALAVGMGFSLTDQVILQPHLALEVATQTFAADLSAARTLAILDQRGFGPGFSLDLPLGSSAYWRVESSIVFGESQARTAATYSTRQEETSYTVPYGRLVSATGFVVPLTGPVFLSVMGGWQETRFAEPKGEADVIGSQANRTGGLTLINDRVAIEDHATLLAPSSLSGWLLRLGVETNL